MCTHVCVHINTLDDFDKNQKKCFDLIFKQKKSRK